MYPDTFQHLRPKFPGYPDIPLDLSRRDSRALPQVYPWDSAKEKTMTIAVGFKCLDGVVLAADSLYTKGDAKLYGQKLFPIHSDGRRALLIAGSGAAPSIQGIVREIKKRLRAAPGATALCFYYPKHIYSAPKDKRTELEAELLIAIWTVSGQTRLFEAFRTSCFETADHRSIGIGSSLASYLNDLFFPAGTLPSVRLAEPLAAYIVGRAKQYVQFCGGDTFVRALLSDGSDEKVWNLEVKESDAHIAALFKGLGQLRGLVGDMPSDASLDLTDFTNHLRDQVRAFRAKQQNLRDKQAQIRKRSGSGPKT